MATLYSMLFQLSSWNQSYLESSGLCGQTGFDLEYTMIMGENGYVEYVGLMNSVIKYDLQEKSWIIKSLPHPNTFARSKAKFTSLFIGRHTWLVSNNDKCQAGEVEMSVKLSTCVEGQFTCGDGVFIDIDERCDRAKHCTDWSDELGCNTVQIPPGYLQECVPIKLGKNSTTIIKVKTVVSFAIKDVTNIFEKEGAIGFRFTLQMEWKDNRVEFLNLREESKMNLLSKSEMLNIWVPSLIFYNTLHEEITELDSASYLFVNREREFVFAERLVIDETKIFKGSENNFIYERYHMKHSSVSSIWRCILLIHKYAILTRE